MNELPNIQLSLQSLHNGFYINSAHHAFNAVAANNAMFH